MSEKASLVAIFTKTCFFSSETPQTDSEPVLGLENLTSRGHNNNKTKNKMCFWKFWLFEKFSTKTKNQFSTNLKISQNPKNRKIENLKILWIFEIFRKHDLVFWSKIFRKTQIFQKQISLFVLFLLCSRGVNFSSPTTGSKSVCGAPPKKLDFFRANPY